MKAEQYVFAFRPTGMPAEDVFRLEETTVPDPGENEVLLKPLFISVDPYMRGRMNDSKSYAKGWEPGKPAEGGIVAEVIESKSVLLRMGDIVTGTLPWATYIIASAGNLRKVDAKRFPAEYYLGVLGMPGLTAYFGVIDICRPTRGETVVVSGAAGAVGIVAGQIAKNLGARVIGIAGSDDKCRMLREEFGYDETLNYKSSKSIRKDIAKICPDGVNCYFDNVGGDITEGVIANLAFHSRIALCGQISQYNSTRLPAGSFMMPILLTRSVLLKGFIVRDYSSRFEEGFARLSELISEGKLKYTTTILEGFHKLPEAFLGLFTGKNSGKMLVKA